MSKRFKVNSIDYYKKNHPHKQLYYDNAITGNGKCYFCKKPIPKGTPIFWFWDKFKKYKKSNSNSPGPAVLITTTMSITHTKESQDLNIKRKICFRCIEKDVFNHILEKYEDEIEKIRVLKKSFKSSLKGKKCKRAIENIQVLEELEKEDFAKNFDFNKFHG